MHGDLAKNGTNHNLYLPYALSGLPLLPLKKKEGVNTRHRKDRNTSVPQIVQAAQLSIETPLACP